MTTEDATEPQATGPHCVRLDERGCMIPRTDAEREADSERIRVALVELATMTHDDLPPASDGEFWRALDAGRPGAPLFDGYY